MGYNITIDDCEFGEGLLLWWKFINIGRDAYLKGVHPVLSHFFRENENQWKSCAIGI